MRDDTALGSSPSVSLKVILFINTPSPEDPDAFIKNPYRHVGSVIHYKVDDASKKTKEREKKKGKTRGKTKGKRCITIETSGAGLIKTLRTRQYFIAAAHS